MLEEIENNKLCDLTFFEGSACTGGCVGGPLNFENNYVARNIIRRLIDANSGLHPDQKVDVSLLTKYPLYCPKPILPNSAMKLDDDIVEAMRKLERIEEFTRSCRLRLRLLRLAHLPDVCGGHSPRLCPRDGLHPHHEGAAEGDGAADGESCPNDA